MKSSMPRSVSVGVLIGVAALAVLLSGGCQQAEMSTGTYPPTATPRLVEIGTAACIPCALMKPALDELRMEYAGRLEVEVIDILLNPAAKTQYNAPFCATQVSIAASGKELYRHVGYSSKKDILANWKTLGVNLDAPARQQ
jgi:thioredoxin 1